MADLNTAFKEQLCGQWGLIALRGILGIVFGVLTFIWPIATILSLAIIWGVFVLADGVTALASSWRMYKNGVKWWPYLVFGLVGVLAGLMALLWPGLTALILLYVIAFWAIFGGITQLMAGINMPNKTEGENHWYLLIGGILGIIFGVLLLFAPLEGALAVVMVIGFYALVTGILALVLAVKLKIGQAC